MAARPKKEDKFMSAIPVRFTKSQRLRIEVQSKIQRIKESVLIRKIVLDVLDNFDSQ